MTNVITIIVVTSNLLFQNRQLTPATNAQMATQQVKMLPNISVDAMMRIFLSNPNNINLTFVNICSRLLSPRRSRDMTFEIISDDGFVNGVAGFY